MPTWCSRKVRSLETVRVFVSTFCDNVASFCRSHAFPWRAVVAASSPCSIRERRAFASCSSCLATVRAIKAACYVNVCAMPSATCVLLFISSRTCATECANTTVRLHISPIAFCGTPIAVPTSSCVTAGRLGSKVNRRVAYVVVLPCFSVPSYNRNFSDSEGNGAFSCYRDAVRARRCKAHCNCWIRFLVVVCLVLTEAAVKSSTVRKPDAAPNITTVLGNTRVSGIVVSKVPHNFTDEPTELNSVSANSWSS